MYYLFLLPILIPNITSDIGIQISTDIKLNITDIVGAIYLVYILLFKGQRTKVILNSKILRVGLLFFFLMIFSTPLGLLNGATIGSSFRVLRNFFLLLETIIITSYYLRDFSEKQVYKRLLFFSWVLIIAHSINIISLYFENLWFQSFRANANFLVFFILYFSLYKNSTEGILMKIIRILTVCLLLLCSFFSQERMQLVALIIAILFGVLTIQAEKILKRNVNVKISINKFVSLFFLLLVGYVFIINILKIEIVQDYIDYFVKYRIGSILNTDGFKFDESLSIRLSQWNAIILKQTNPIYMIIGSGLNSIYEVSTAITFVVDGMWLWVYKDMGVIGVGILICWFKVIFKEISQIRFNRNAVIFGMLGVVFLTIFIPNVFYNIHDAVGFGFILALIMKIYSNDVEQLRVDKL